ncbi:MAG TPA: cupredoxin domain-containing protein, partial [Actinomycetota bacterium]|nr:cupredoxin domain-containing protein [Actinomycetota bacterium]
MHRWWVFLHIAGAFGFLMAHGVSAYVTLRLPKERDPARVSQLLELSASSVGFMWNSIGLLLIGGIAAGFTGHFWGQGWIWAAIVVLVVVMAAMYAMGTTWAKRLRTISSAMVGGTEAVSRPQFEEILRSRRPYTIAAIGFVGLLAILWLMIFKPTLGFGGELAAECPEAPPEAVAVCAVDDQSFVEDRIDVAPNTPFDIEFANLDDGVQHNVAIYEDDSAEEAVFVGDLIAGSTTITYHVPALLGEYFFRCDVHPQMNGTLETV